MKTVCETNQCAGCMACVDICPNGSIKITDGLSVYNAVIQADKCVGCNACHQVCPSNHPAQTVSPLNWYQGWSVDFALRKKSSSGGIAAELSAVFIESGGVVCSCAFKNGRFMFAFAEKVEELNQFVGSKYVKSNPAGVYKQIKDRLKSGREVLFIGLPCQVSALKNYTGKGLEKSLYTADLICHGTPSPELLEIFLKQYGFSLNRMKDIQFRVKAKFQVYGDSKGIITGGVSDKYSIAFLDSMIYTESCYRCHFAKQERVADLTLGDSWGSDLPMEEQKKGVSLVLCQTEKGMELLKKARLHLEPVDKEKAINSNHQLKHPSIMPAARENFFRGISNGKKFNRLVFRYFPKQCLRQDLKEILIRTKLIGGV